MVTIKKALEALGDIKNTSSRTEKESILASNKDNKALQEMLVQTYNPFITYGIKKIPPIEVGEVKSYEKNYENFTNLLNQLAERKLTGNNAIKAVQNVLSSMREDEVQWYSLILQKDLKIGITDKTINKVIKGLVPVFTCALANSWEPKKTPKRFVADRKEDGYRCLAFKYSHDRVELRTRNGHILEGYAGIESDVLNYLPEGFVYDGEIVGRDRSFNAIQKSAFKKTSTDTPDKDGILVVFDAVMIKEFMDNNFLYPYETRLSFLDQLRDILEGCRSLAPMERTRELRSDRQEDMDALMLFHRDITSQGWEGTMIKSLDAKYKMDKSNNILKMKDFYEIDLVVETTYRGKEGTKYEGVMGGVIVTVKDTDIIEQCPVNDPKHTKKLQYIEGGSFAVSVGSGFTDTERMDFTLDPDKIIGKTITISFQETSINKEGQHSLRFPTLVKIRTDK